MPSLQPVKEKPARSYALPAAITKVSPVKNGPAVGAVEPLFTVPPKPAAKVRVRFALNENVLELLASK